MLEYRVDDKALDAQRFIELAQQVWPGDYDPEKTRRALERTINITAWDGTELVGCLRILTDGCFFGTIPEVLVLPRYQRQIQIEPDDRSHRFKGKIPPDRF